MKLRSPLPLPVFTKAERAAIDAENVALKSAFREAGLKERRDGFPFRQYRNLTVRTLAKAGPRNAWIRNSEHAGLLLAFARQNDDPALYVRIPYAAMLAETVTSLGVDADRLPPECYEGLMAALPKAAAFIDYGRDKLKAAHDSVAT